MPRHFDHIDLRVPDLARATPFYQTLMPAVGFPRRVEVDGWLQFEAGEPGIAEFFGVTESAAHQPNENRVAFRAESQAKVDRVAEILVEAGAAKIEGPMNYEEGYYAVFFEDPFGNRFEVCHRTQNAAATT